MPPNIVMPPRILNPMHHRGKVPPKPPQSILKVMLNTIANIRAQISDQNKVEFQAFGLVNSHYWEEPLWTSHVLIFVITHPLLCQITTDPVIETPVPPTRELPTLRLVDLHFPAILRTEPLK